MGQHEGTSGHRPEVGDGKLGGDQAHLTRTCNPSSEQRTTQPDTEPARAFPGRAALGAICGRPHLGSPHLWGTNRSLNR
eukprot:5206079-Alexandrium_andersonii.AAC.1